MRTGLYPIVTTTSGLPSIAGDEPARPLGQGGGGWSPAPALVDAPFVHHSISIRIEWTTASQEDLVDECVGADDRRISLDIICTEASSWTRALELAKSKDGSSGHRHSLRTG